MLRSGGHLESENKKRAFYLEILSIIPYFQEIPISGSSVIAGERKYDGGMDEQMDRWTDGRTSRKKYICLQPVGQRHNDMMTIYCQ